MTIKLDKFNYLNANWEFGLREGFNKKKKKIREFSLRGGEGLHRFPNFFFIFKHGLIHPEMQRKFFSPLGDPPSQTEAIPFYLVENLQKSLFLWL